MWSAARDRCRRAGLEADNVLAICCRALAPPARRAPPARGRAGERAWSIVDNLRWYRTMVFGRSPGFASGPATVGPWRAIRLRVTDGARR